MRILFNFIKSQQGGLSILWAFILPIIIGFTGLGVEAALWYGEKNDLQAATDAATYTTAYYIGTSSSLSTVATNEMTRNGYGASRNITLTVNHPPTSGAYAGNSSAVEVISSVPQPLFFSKSFLSNIVTIKSRAVALANPSGWGSGCMWSDESNTSAESIFAGNVNLCMPGCADGSNGTGNSAITLKGSANITVYNLISAGGITNDGSATETSSAQNITSSSPLTDPFSSLTAPSSGTCLSSPPTSGALTAGTYCSNFTLTANQSATMSGTYIFTHGTFKITSGNTVTGSNVMIVLTGDASLDWTGGSQISLSAISDTSNPYHGILIYQSPSDTQTDTINGNSNTNLNGVIYAPDASVKFSGGTGTCHGNSCTCNSSTVSSCTKIFAGTITFTGDSSIASNCSGYPWIPSFSPPGGAGKPVTLVE